MAMRNRLPFQHLALCAFLVLFIGFGFTSSAHPHPHNPDTLNFDIKRIVIASEPDYPPFSFVNKNGVADGFSVELFMAAARAVGIEADIRIGVWNQIMQDLAEGRIDALPLVGRTPEREVLFDFTMPYQRLHGAIFVNRNNNRIKAEDDLRLSRVAVMEGDNAEEYLKRKGLFHELVTTHTFEEAFRLLAQGEVDAVVIQKVVGLEIIRSLGLKHIEPLNSLFPDFRQDFCFAVQKGNTALLSRLNEGLSIVIANKTYDELHLKWFGPAHKEKLSVRELLTISLKVLIPLLIILGVIQIVLLRGMVKSRTQRLQQEVLGHQKTNLLLEKMEKASDIGGWDYDVSTKRVSWTKGVYAIHGVSPEEFDPSNKDVDICFYHPDDKEQLEKAFNEILETGKPYDLELRLMEADTIHKWVRTTGQAEYQDGEIVRVFGSVLDITESKMAENALRESELKLSEIFNSTNEAIIIHDAATGEILDCNSSTLELYAYSTRESLIGKSVADISLNEHPYDQAEAYKKIQTARDKGKQTFEWIAKRSDGSTFWVEVSLRFIELSNRDRILAVVRDSSERKRIEAELHEQHAIFNHLMEKSPIYVFFKDENIRPIMLSKNYEQMLNMPLSQILGKTMDELFPSDLAKSMIADDQKILHEGKTIMVDEELNGRFYTTIKFPIFIGGNPRYLAGYTIDITDRKQAEEELLRLKAELEQKVVERTNELNLKVEKLNKSQKAMLHMVEDLNVLTSELKKERENLRVSNRELEAFSYSVSHDLRAPLRAIEGFTRILSEDYGQTLDEEGMRILGIVRDSVLKMDKLISDLLSLSRVTRLEMKISRIDMAGMANSMYHEVLGAESDSNITLTINPLPEVYADTTLMRLVWQNLIGNALKYSKPKGRISIEISGTSSNEEHIFSIKDNGVGFDPNYKHKIFDTFQRLHRADEFEGTGVGLSVVHRIVSRHGGRVWADGEVGVGATFWFTLPKGKE